MSNLQKIVVLCVAGGTILIGGLFVLGSHIYNGEQISGETAHMQSDTTPDGEIQEEFSPNETPEEVGEKNTEVKGSIFRPEPVLLKEDGGKTIVSLNAGTLGMRSASVFFHEFLPVLVIGTRFYFCEVLSCERISHSFDLATHAKELRYLNPSSVVAPVRPPLLTDAGKLIFVGSGGDTRNNTGFYVATCSDFLCKSSSPEVSLIDKGIFVGRTSSVDFGRDGSPVIVYIDNQYGDRKLRLVICGDEICSKVPGRRILDSQANNPQMRLNSSGLSVIAYAKLNEGTRIIFCGDRFCSYKTTSMLPKEFSMSSFGIGHDKFPVFAGWENGLVLYRCIDEECIETPQKVVLDSSSVKVHDASLDFGARGEPIISYLSSPTHVGANLSVAICVDRECSDWNIEVLDNEESYVGEGSFITATPYGNPFITYGDRTNNTTRIISCKTEFCKVK